MAGIDAAQRIHVVDAFRGFALTGIVLVHMVEQYLGSPPTEEITAVALRGPLDNGIQAFLEIFFRGKFFAMFSFLFGLSFFIQMDRAAKRGVDLKGRFAWRVTLLFLIGFAHSLFYRGDILMIYAVLALFLVPFYRVSTAVVLAVSAALILGAGRYIVFAFAGGETLISLGDMEPDLPHNQAYYAALQSGSLMDVFASNVWNGQLSRLEFQVNVFGRWYLTFAFFLLGLLAGRSRLFEHLDEWHSKIRKGLWLGLAATVVTLVATFALFATAPGSESGPEFKTWHEMFALTAYDLFNISLTSVILCSFLLIYRRAAGERILVRLAPYGRMALTNYFLQTLVGTFVLYNWGLGYLGKVSNTEMFVLALVVIAVQVYLSGLWLQRFRYGPLEWLWRSGTLRSWQPLIRQPAAN